jgi:hypothetical protein
MASSRIDATTQRYRRICWPHFLQIFRPLKQLEPYRDAIDFRPDSKKSVKKSDVKISVKSLEDD